ncbi:MAG: 4-hydroxyacetophenone monooxygenase, partial [Actinobacteria bacterium]|nr:4-hydroxyacetophenone monooxygenase [Actinomycetota bacterium]
MTNNNLGSQHDFAGLPFADDDASLARHIADLSVPTLMLSMVHMAGDISVLDGLPRPAGIYLNEVQGFMSDEDQQLVRERALEVISKYRDGGCVLPGSLSADLIHEMMNLLVVQEVPDEYVPLLLEELGLDSPGTREVALEGISADKRSAFNVVVIGAGMSGILA